MFCGFNIALAEYTDANGKEWSGPPTEAEAAAKGSATTVTVTEDIPGMGCVLDPKSGNGITKRKYTCTIQPGFGSVMLILQ